MISRYHYTIREQSNAHISGLKILLKTTGCGSRRRYYSSVALLRAGRQLDAECHACRAFSAPLIHHRIGPRGDCVQLVLNRLSGVPDRDLVCIGGNTDWLANNDREPTQRQIDGRAIPANAAGTQLRRGRTRPRLDRICRTPDASGPEP